MQAHSEAKTNQDNTDSTLQKVSKDALNILEQISKVNDEILAMTDRSNKSAVVAKENSAIRDKFTTYVIAERDLNNNNLALSNKLETIQNQTIKVGKSFKTLLSTQNTLKEFLGKNATRTDIDSKLTAMVQAYAEFIKEYKTLQATLPFPAYKTFKTKVEATAKEFSNVQSAEGIVDALPKLLTLQNRSFALLIQLIDCKIAQSEYVSSLLKRFQEGSKKLVSEYNVLADQAKQKLSQTPAAVGGTMIHISPKEKPRAGLEVKTGTGTTPTQTPPGSAEHSPPSSPSSSDNGSHRGSPDRAGHSPKMYKPSPDTSPKQQPAAAPSDPKAACCTVG